MGDDVRFEMEAGDEGYPRMLLDLEQPPRLYVRGSLAAFEVPCISVIGARRASPYGIACAELAARIAVEAGVTVVSGGAIGCDQAAGRAALKAGGRHILVFGTGADVVYPPSAADLVDAALDAGGAVVSLERWGSPPRRYAFPKRNAVIAALSAALVICEAGMPSGTFSTAETATALGRELLCMPGSMFSGLSAGTNRLIADGACCVSDEEALEVAVSRVYGTLRFTHGAARGVPGLSPEEKRVMSALTAAPLRIEVVAAHLGTSVVRALRTVGGLEARGLVERLADGSYVASRLALQLSTSFGTMDGAEPGDGAPHGSSG